MNLRLIDLALWTRGVLQGADATVSGVFTDTRKPVAGGLFVALKGEHFDAHEFVGQAKQGGAAAALVAHPVAVDLPQVVVADTLFALGDLASAVRAQRRARVAGITGSNGKTTVKTLLASILAHCGKTHVNAGNLNNEIGLPLSILSMPEDAQYAVLEMGAGKPGDIEYLAAIARAEIALVNNVAPAHLERMGSLEGIAQTKGAIYAALPARGVAVVNADDAFAAYFIGVAGTRHVLSFGLEHQADVRAQIHGVGATSQFSLLTPAGRIEVNLPLPGRHNVLNALAAATLALAFDAPLAAIKQGLETAAPVAGRLIRHTMTGGWSLIDDSYNANPGSTASRSRRWRPKPAKPGWCWATCASSAPMLGNCTRRPAPWPSSPALCICIPLAIWPRRRVPRSARRRGISTARRNSPPRSPVRCNRARSYS